MDLSGLPWAEMGVVSAIVVIVLFGMYFAKDIVLALLKTPRVSKREAGTPEPSIGRETMGWLKAVKAGEIKAEKAKIDESQDERMERLEQELLQLRGRVDDAFSVIGKVRDASIAADEKLDGKIEDQRKKCDRTNRDQDRLIRGLATSQATVEGMIRAKSSGSGATQFIKDEDKP